MITNIPITAHPRTIQIHSSRAFATFMDHIMQLGGVEVMVKWSHLASCWTWDCVWGCSGFDHEGEQEARDAFLSHECFAAKQFEADLPHGGLAWTPDEEIEEGQARLRESHPEVWDAWLDYCRTDETPC